MLARTSSRLRVDAPFGWRGVGLVVSLDLDRQPLLPACTAGKAYVCRESGQAALFVSDLHHVLVRHENNRVNEIKHDEEIKHSYAIHNPFSTLPVFSLGGRVVKMDVKLIAGLRVAKRNMVCLLQSRWLKKLPENPTVPPPTDPKHRSL